MLRPDVRAVLPVIFVAVYAQLACGGCRNESSESSIVSSVSSNPPLAFERLPSFEKLFQKASRSVVNVSASYPLPIPESWLPRRKREAIHAVIRSLGSGFVIDALGHVVTCSSVVRDAQKIEVVLADTRRIKARLLGIDEVSDLALLAIPAHLAPPSLSVGKSNALRVGEWVAAIGYPFGLSHTITAGVVSGIRSGEKMQVSHGLVFTDAAINPGSNGGPLLDLSGKVVGVSFISTRPDASMGRAVPVEEALELLDAIKSGRPVKRMWLGVSVQTMDAALAGSFGWGDVVGALVNQVRPGSPAARAGIMPADIIVSVGGRPVRTLSELMDRLGARAPSRSMEIEVFRSGKVWVLSVGTP